MKSILILLVVISIGLILRLWTVFKYGPMIHEHDP
jgi:hypothetical protein